MKKKINSLIKKYFENPSWRFLVLRGRIYHCLRPWSLKICIGFKLIFKHFCWQWKNFILVSLRWRIKLIFVLLWQSIFGPRYWYRLTMVNSCSRGRNIRIVDSKGMFCYLKCDRSVNKKEKKSSFAVLAKFLEYQIASSILHHDSRLLKSFDKWKPFG